jgi:hypothetical protein
LRKWREENEKRRSIRTDKSITRDGAINTAISGTPTGDHNRIGNTGTIQRLKRSVRKMEQQSEKIKRHHRRH